MRTISGGRGEGKTTTLIKISADSGAYIVCFSMKEADRVHMEAIKMGLKIPLPITYDEFISRHYSPKGVRSLLIDNVDMLLQYIAKGTPIEGYSLTPSGE